MPSEGCAIFRFGYLRTPLPVEPRLINLDQLIARCVSWKLAILGAH
jgi:hypothetical protein